MSTVPRTSHGQLEASANQELAEVLEQSAVPILPDRFLQLLSDSASRLMPAHPRPAETFTTDQREALTEVGLDLAQRRPRETDPQAAALADGVVLRASALSVTEVAELLRVDSSRVRHRLAAGQLTGWKSGGGWALPAWQFTGHYSLPHLAAVLAALPAEMPSLVVARFMSTPQPDLELDGAPSTPREWLQAGGNPAMVVSLASGMAVFA